MNRSHAILASSLLILLASPAGALADVVHLQNGRSVEGQVVKRTDERVHLEVPGGRMVLPRTMVREIEERLTPQEAYAERARETDMSDPGELEDLADWAGSRGLGDRASHLREMARGLRLERRVAEAQASEDGAVWARLYWWARRQGVAEEVQRWVLQQGREVDPEDPSLQRAAEAYREAIRKAKAEQQARAARRERERAEVARRRETSSAREERIAALEQRLARQRERLQELEARDDRTPQRRRRVLRRRGRAGVVVTPSGGQCLPRSATVEPCPSKGEDSASEPSAEPPSGPIRTGQTSGPIKRGSSASSGPIRQGGSSNSVIKVGGSE